MFVCFAHKNSPFMVEIVLEEEYVMADDSLILAVNRTYTGGSWTSEL